MLGHGGLQRSDIKTLQHHSRHLKVMLKMQKVHSIVQCVQTLLLKENQVQFLTVFSSSSEDVYIPTGFESKLKDLL